VTTCTVANQTLHLNGTGVRKVFMVEVYKASLYAAAAVRRRADIRQAHSPYRLTIEFSYGPISVERMRKAWTDAFLNCVSDAQLEQEKDAFNRFYESILEYRKGDVVTYDMHQDQLSVFTNDVLLCTIPSGLIADAVIDVVVGDRPIDERMKQGLLNA
jgi:hypothetical protein